MITFDYTALQSPLPILRLKKAYADKKFTESVNVLLAEDFDNNTRDITEMVRVIGWDYKVEKTKDGVILVPEKNQ